MKGEDALALMPTGGGKSICFQVPALAQEGLCLVISPLIALMKDQVENLKKRNIGAISIQSGMTYFEIKEALQNAAYGPYKFLYVSPERLETDLFREYLPAFNLNLIAVDEAHCISQWGYDFRPPYLRISRLREEFPDVPLLALTASATPLVQDDICDKLQFRQKNILRQSFHRPNLSFSVFRVDSKINKLNEILTRIQGSAIIYVRNRKRTREIAHLLKLSGIAADYYHAGLTRDERSQRQDEWMNDKTRVIVCTNAFGMGIDKPDVRVVAHLDIPDNLESYYQEAGRAGRDSKRAFAVLLYSHEELSELKQLPDKRFPSVVEIRNVYQALANHLQIAVGAGKGMYFDFNLNDFIRYFKLDVFVVVNVLKALEQEGYLSFNGQVFLPAKAGFTATREELHMIEKERPHLDLLVKSLLRAYEGIFDNEVSINENLLSKLVKLSADEVKQQLTELDGLGILEYKPQKETPQLFFMENRAPAQSLVFDAEAYLKRKKLYQERIEAIEKYVLLNKDCRALYIASYFGDSSTQQCGVCDNCLASKNALLTDEEFTRISSDILQTVKLKASDIGELMQLTSSKKDKVWRVLDYLQGEGKITIDKQGLIAAAN